MFNATYNGKSYRIRTVIWSQTGAGASVILAPKAGIAYIGLGCSISVSANQTLSLYAPGSPDHALTAAGLISVARGLPWWGPGPMFFAPLGRGVSVSVADAANHTGILSYIEVPAAEYTDDPV